MGDSIWRPWWRFKI